MRRQSGFTFLEMLIVLTIMAVLTVASNTSIQNALRAKLKLQEQLDDMSQVRDALRVVERDINLAFHYRDLETEFKQMVQQQAANQGGKNNPNPNPDPNAPQPPPPPTMAPGLAKWLQPDPGRKDPVTHFIGSSDELYFPTMNAGRIAEDVPQADFIKVGYYLSSCSKIDSKTANNGKCLMRRSGNLVEGDITKGGESVVLAENITEFKLRYIGKGKQDWVSDWSTKGGDAVTRDNFPDAVEVSVTITKGNEKKQKKISMQIVAGVHFPNNKPAAQGGTRQ
jgi:prepilin-type N-terminal cleavage/methylation domain-containing protein